MQEKKKPIYIIARALTPWGIKRQVNKKIEEGYEPIGGVHHGLFSQWHQAMISKEV